jgi:hypothetical protein
MAALATRFDEHVRVRSRALSPTNPPDPKPAEPGDDYERQGEQEGDDETEVA